MEASCNMGYIFLVIFVFILHWRFALVQYLKTKITRKIYPILHSAPCDNYYIFLSLFIYSMLLQAVFQCMLYSLRNVINILMITILFLVIFSIMGVQLFMVSHFISSHLDFK